MDETPVPLAIIGMSCRFPGGANDPKKLWCMIEEGRNAWTDVPSDRYNWKSFYHPDPDSSAGHNHRGGHYLDQDIAAFDARFFGISPLEAKAIDPQQRIQLETAYEALENAGVPLEKIRGSDTAVYVAAFNHDYNSMLYKDTCDLPKYMMTGTGSSIVSNRISYLLDLKGPSVTLDTGCSGGLVALHLACQSIRTGESRMAIAGGTSVILNPDMMIHMSMLQFLNDEGKTFSFDSRGSGYGRGEGAAAVIVKRLDDALKDGDAIRAVIRASAAGQDGRTNGISMPNSEAQRQLIRSVYQKARLDPAGTGYIECHGTGTVVGDRAEVDAIGSTFGLHRTSPLYIGSIKGNIGHLESASGIAGLIKAVLVLEKQCVPPAANFQTIKKELEMEKWNIKVREKVPLIGESIDRASVNSFGYGGTNAHVILDATRTNNVTSSDFTASTTPSPPRLFTLSAKSESSLLRLIEILEDWLDERKGDRHLRDLAYTLTQRRSALTWRYSFVAATYQDVRKSIDRTSVRPIRAPSNPPQIVFLFTGQGANWYGMGRELLSMQPRFKASIALSEKILKQLGATWSLRDELMADEGHSRINNSEIGQPASTAIQIALVDLLESLNIRPKAVLGHSSGEIAAAYATGALTHYMALLVSYKRGFLANMCKATVQARGAMLVTGLGEVEIYKYISQVRRGICSVACVNSPQSTTISGDESAILELKDLLEDDSVFCRRLKVDTAYHSHHMRSISEFYLESLGGYREALPKGSVQMFSSVTGKEKKEGFSASYWENNLVSKVKYCGALQELCRSLDNGSSKTSSALSILIEVGPHSVLAGPTRESIAEMRLASFDHIYIPTLVRNKDATRSLLNLTKTLFEYGSPLDMAMVNSFNNPAQECNVVTDLDPYPWDHSETYWHESRISRNHRLRPHPHHDLLGIRIPTSTTIEPAWRHVVSIDALPWLREHNIDGFTVFPASGYLCMAMEAIRQLTLEVNSEALIHSYTLRNISFSKALYIPDSPDKIELQLHLKCSGISTDHPDQTQEFAISSVLNDGSCHKLCTGTIIVEFASVAQDPQAVFEQHLNKVSLIERLDLASGSCDDSMDAESFYQSLKTHGNVYGPCFAMVKDVKFGHNVALGTIVTPNVCSTMPSQFMQPHVIHPSTFDSLFHPGALLYGRHFGASSIVVVAIREVVISAEIGASPGYSLLTASTLLPTGPIGASIEVIATQDYGYSEKEPRIHISGLEFRGVGDSSETISASSQSRNMGYEFTWGRDVDFIDQSLFPSYSEPKRNAQEDKLRTLNTAASIYIRASLAEFTAQGLPLPEGYLLEFYKWMHRHQDIDPQVSGRREDQCSKQMSSAENIRIMNESHAFGVEGEMVHRVGKNLTRILSNQIDALSVMMEDDLLYNLYGGELFGRLYDHAIEYVKCMSYKNPQMKVLELGAGTGGATLPLFRGIEKDGSLPLARYDFTDVSTGFFERSRSILEPWGKQLQFKKLDLEEDPSNQGFEEGSYDLVIASNVLHVPASVDDTVRSVRRLLKPGGILLLIETTRPIGFYNLFAGILPGWWLGAKNGRTESPLLSTKQWHSVLSGNGFNGVEVVADDYPESAQISSVIVSRAVLEDVDQGSPLVDIICEPGMAISKGLFASELSNAFGERGLQTRRVQWPFQASGDTVYVVLDDGDNPLLSDFSCIKFEQITNLVSMAKNILWITTTESISSNYNPKRGLIAGFSRVARTEGLVNFVTVDVQRSAGDAGAMVTFLSEIVYRCFHAPASVRTMDQEYMYRDGHILIPRLLQNQDLNNRIHLAAGQQNLETALFHQESRPLKVHVATPGLLDSLRFVDDDSRAKPLGSDELEIHVEACGVDNRDVLLALGQVNDSMPMIGECSGTVTVVGTAASTKFKLGDRVCVWGGTAFANEVRVPMDQAQALPSDISFSVGASIPTSFTVAYYALIESAGIKKGQSVLIYDATSSIGQAALLIAQHAGAEIFAIVNDADERQLIIERQIPDDHVFLNRSSAFRKGVMRLTDGSGCDVVLDANPNASMHDCWACIARFGKYLSISNGHSRKDKLSMDPFELNATFSSISMAVMSQYQPKKRNEIFNKVTAMFSAGHLAPTFSITEMAMTDIDRAFKLVHGRKIPGKLVLLANDQTLVKTTPLPGLSQLHSEGTYVIAGGLGGLGLRICQFLSERGAKHVVLLTRRTLEDSSIRHLKDQFQSMEIRVVTCNIGDESQVKEMVNGLAKDLPPVKGVIQSAMVLQDRMLEQMSSDDFKVALEPKVHGTMNLLEVVRNQNLDFFVMLSSTTGIIGTRGQANYAAGNTFQDALASAAHDHNIRIISIDLGGVDDSGSISQRDSVKDNLRDQGFILMKTSEVLASIDFAISPLAAANDCKQIVLGFDRKSITAASNFSLLQNPLFSHLPQLIEEQAVENSTSKHLTIEGMLKNAKSSEEISSVITSAIARKISTLVALDYDKIELGTPLTEFGLDSLIVVQLKNWIGQTFATKVTSAELSDSADILAITGLIVDRSTVIQSDPPNGPQPALATATTDDAVASQDVVQRKKLTSTDLPKLPVPDFDESIQWYLRAVQPLFSEEEYERTLRQVAEFSKRDGMGRKLHARIVEKAKDPNIRNWQAGIYETGIYFKDRTPLVPFLNFFGAHLMSPVPHTQAERAAVVSHSCFEFSQLLEKGELELAYLNDKALDSYHYQYLFNTTRMPSIKGDQLVRHPGNHYLVAFRHGHCYKVNLMEGETPVSYTKLKGTFEAILAAAPDEVSWIGILSADYRDSWATVRDLVMDVSKENEEWVKIIEAAVFVVYLDDAEPVTGSQRAHQFLHGDGSNRWNDKTLQFSVCNNGISGAIGEHAKIDGLTFTRMNDYVTERILSLKPERDPSLTNGSTPTISLETHTFTTTETINTHITRVKDLFQTNIARFKYVGFSNRDLISSFWRDQRIPPKSGMQMVFQLAFRRFWGHNPASFETVSLHTFQQGRIEISHTHWASGSRWCDAATKGEQPSNLKDLFLDAVKDHANGLARASRGHGIDRYYLALAEVIEEGETLPELLADPLYLKARPMFAMTDCLRSGALEVGTVLNTHVNAVWSHFEIFDDIVTFSIWANPKDGERFRDILLDSARFVKELFTTKSLENGDVSIL